MQAFSFGSRGLFWPYKDAALFFWVTAKIFSCNKRLSDYNQKMLTWQKVKHCMDAQFLLEKKWHSIQQEELR